MAWTQAEIEAIRGQLHEIGASKVFQSAGRMAALLSYLVDAELNGEAAQLNQSRVAIDVLGRNETFDPSEDSIVRVEMGRLRSKLLEYYANEGKSATVFIELPKGRYKPLLAFRATDANKASDFRQEIKFCRAADGVALAYAMSGQGIPLVKASNWLTHLEFDVQSPVWRHWWHGFSRRHRLIRYDPRGCGLSDWEVPDISFEKLVCDLECVANHAAPEKFALLGTSQGVSLAIAYAVRHPERVSHLILYGGSARGSLKRGDTEREDTHHLLQDIIRVGWGQPHGAFRHVFGAIFMPEGTNEQFRWFDELSRASMSAENAARMRHCMAGVSVEPLLQDVKVPTLILHAADEILVPFAEARLLAARIPGARLVPLDSKNHLILEQEPAWAKLLDEVESFTSSTD